MKNGKNWLIGVLAVGVSLLLLNTVFNGSFIKKENNIADIVKLDTTPPDKFKDDMGYSHVQKTVINLSEEQKDYFRSQIDSLREQLKVKDKQIVGVTTVAGEAKTEFKPTVTDRDSLGADISYNSRWFDLKGNTLNKESWKLAFRDSMTLAFINVPTGFLNLRKSYRADASSANKDMVYTNIRSWQVPQTGKARIGFGATVGYGIQLNRNNQITYGPQATVGLQIRF